MFKEKNYNEKAVQLSLNDTSSQCFVISFCIDRFIYLNINSYETDKCTYSMSWTCYRLLCQWLGSGGVPEARDNCEWARHLAMCDPQQAQRRQQKKNIVHLIRELSSLCACFIRDVRLCLAFIFPYLLCQYAHILS